MAEAIEQSSDPLAPADNSEPGCPDGEEGHQAEQVASARRKKRNRRKRSSKTPQVNGVLWDASAYALCILCAWYRFL